MAAAFTEDWHDMLWKEKKSQLDQFATDEFDGFPTERVILDAEPEAES